MSFYILSRKWSKFGEPLVWWRPDDRGYTTNLDEAGEYSQALVFNKTAHYNNGDSTVAVPVKLARAAAKMVAFPDHSTMQAFGARMLGDGDLAKALADAEALREYAWHNETVCTCEVCRKIKAQMDEAVRGG